MDYKGLSARIFHSWWFRWFLIGLLLRLVLMPITVHPDLWALSFSQYFFNQERIFNIYDYLAKLPPDHALVRNYGTNFFTYPPLTYFTLGFFGFLLKPLSDPLLSRWLMNNLSQAYQHPLLFRYLFLFKLPYLFFDFGVAFLLMALFRKESEKKAAFLLWLFNPLAFYTTFMIGQFDILPVFWVVLSLYLLLKKKTEWAAVALGIGGAFKMFPLLFLPLLILAFGRTVGEKLRLALFGFLPYLLTVAPFLSSAAFRRVALVSAQSQKMFFMTLPVSGAEGVSLFAFFYFLVCWAVAYGRIAREKFWLSPLIVLLLLFSTTHYHPQWFLWLTPFLILELIKSRFVHWWLDLILLVCFLFLVFCFEPSLHLGLFVPLNPSLADLSGGLGELIGRFYNPFQLKTLVRSLFAATAAFLIYLSCRRNAQENC